MCGDSSACATNKFYSIFVLPPLLWKNKNNKKKPFFHIYWRMEKIFYLKRFDWLYHRSLRFYSCVIWERKWHYLWDFLSIFTKLIPFNPFFVCENTVDMKRCKYLNLRCPFWCNPILFDLLIQWSAFGSKKWTKFFNDWI